MNPSGRGRNDQWMEKVGLAITMRREDLGLTQAQLSERTGIRAPVICQYETGRVQPMSHRLFQIAQALDCSMDLFYSEIRGVANGNVESRNVA